MKRKTNQPPDKMICRVAKLFKQIRRNGGRNEKEKQLKYPWKKTHEKTKERRKKVVGLWYFHNILIKFWSVLPYTEEGEEGEQGRGGIDEMTNSQPCRISWTKFHRSNSAGKKSKGEKIEIKEEKEYDLNTIWNRKYRVFQVKCMITNRNISQLPEQ